MRLGLALLFVSSVAFAQGAPQDALRDGNTAAQTGDWARVSILIEPLLRTQLPPVDLAEAHRLAGLAAFYQQRLPSAEQHFLAYLKIELDGRLDPALYQPEVVSFFEDVKQRHSAELRALRPKQRRYWLLNLVPPGGQIQNGDKVKAIVVGSALGAFAIGNVTTYLVLRSWCKKVAGDHGSSVTCDEPKDRSASAGTLRTLNIVSGIGLIATYAYGVYDGMSGYLRQSKRAAPYMSPTEGGGMIGIVGSF